MKIKTTRLPIAFALLFAMTVILGSAQLAWGHFVWIAKDAKSGEIRIYFGEGPEPDQKMYLKGISKIKTHELGSDNKWSSLSCKQVADGDEGWFVASNKKNGSEVIGDVSYGLFGRGEKMMLLHYSAKYAELKGDSKLSLSTKSLLPLDIQASSQGKKIKVAVLFHGKPVKQGEVVVVDSAGKTHDLKTDDSGLLELDSRPGRFLVRAKGGQAKPGKLDGKEYSEERNYCTLVLDVTGSQTADDSDSSSTKVKLADIPTGLTSFGGAIAGDKIYVYGGHTGKAHQYYESGQNKILYELDLKKPGKWNEVAKGLGLQGLAMISYKNKVYRLGGFHAHNKEGEKHDLRSVTDFAVFDSASKKWKQLSPMPIGRSSFDAVVVDDTIYVVGGWTMNGKEGTEWCETAIKYDFSSKAPKWEALPTPPFQRRALSVGYQNDSLVVVGGMQQKGGPTKKVSLFNLKTGKWSDGPELPGEGRMEGFGSACFNVGGDLVASTYGGGVYRLSKDFSKWESIGKLDEGRFFHRLLPINQKQFVLIGGANMDSGKFFELEVRSK